MGCGHVPFAAVYGTEGRGHRQTWLWHSPANMEGATTPDRMSRFANADRRTAHSQLVQRPGSRSGPRSTSCDHGPTESEIRDGDTLLRQHAFGEGRRTDPHRLQHYS